MPIKLNDACLHEAGALWRHDGNPKTPHAILASGNHSDGYCNMAEVYSRPSLLKWIVLWWVRNLTEESRDADWVVGSAMGGVIPAFALADALDARVAFSEKHNNQMAIQRHRLRGRVLLCEDAVTTARTSSATFVEILQNHPEAEILRVIPVLVNRSGVSEISLPIWGSPELTTFKILSPFEIKYDRWEPADCPLCAAGSQPLRPKRHWDRFVS